MTRRRLPRNDAQILDQVILLESEIVYDTTNKEVRIGDGTTMGGKPIGADLGSLGTIIEEGDDVAAKAATGDASQAAILLRGEHTSGNITLSSSLLKFEALSGQARVSKSANGGLLTYAGSYGGVANITFDGQGFSGANLEFTGGENELLHVNSMNAGSEAVASDGAVHIFGGIYYTDNADLAFPDIRIGKISTATLYSALFGMRTTQPNHGIHEIDTGSTFLVGCQIGGLKIELSGTPPEGLNGGHRIGNRITGDIVCEISTSTWVGNLVSSGHSVTFGAGTSSHSFGPSNQVGPEDNINNLGSAASHICVNRGDGVRGLGGPVYCFGASGPSAEGSGAELWIGPSDDGGAPDPATASIGTPGFWLGSFQKGYRIRNSAGDPVNAVNCASGSNISVGNTDGALELASNGQIVIPAVALLQNQTNDAGAAGAGVPIGGLYRNGSVLMVRVA